MRKPIGFILCLLGVAGLIFACVLTAVDVVGTDAELYYELQMDADILEYAGVSAEDLLRLDQALAAYLKGDSHMLDLSVEVFGREQWAFNSKESTHMKDCAALFELLYVVRAVLLPLGFCLVAASWILLRDRKKFRLAAWLAPLAIIVPLGALAAWAALDFNAAFNFFHEILFTNDLWLLDPDTDLLIRICPLSMFMNMGARIGLLSVLAVFAVPALATAATLVKKERG